jgi:hypothetical protein
MIMTPCTERQQTTRARVPDGQLPQGANTGNQNDNLL